MATIRIPTPLRAYTNSQAEVKVTGGTVEVVSEGHWKLFTP